MKLPPGFVLEEDTPNLPPGFVLEPEQPEQANMLQAIGTVGMGAINALDTGVTLAGRGLEEVVGKITGKQQRSIEDNDALFDNLNRRHQQRLDFVNPERRPISTPQAVVGGIATLPAQVLALPGQAAERMKTMIDMGESTDAAIKAGTVDTAINMASVAAPAAIGRNMLQKVATGAAINTGLGAYSDAYTQSVAEQKETKEAFNPLDPQRRVVEAVTGGGIGAVAKTRPAPKSKTVTDVATRLDRVDEVGVKPEVAPESLQAMQAIEQQKVIGRQYGGREALGVDLPELRQTPRAGELETVQTPLDTLGVGRRVDPETGKVMTGMHPDVPTMDFPLRQEVLQEPAIRDAVDAFRREYAEAKTEQEKAVLESRFMDGMRQLGIYKPQDAVGLQPLYESKGPALRYPEGIRKTGERLETKTETQVPEFVPPRTLAEKGAFPKQRGAINPKVFNERFIQKKDLGRGIRLTAYSVPNKRMGGKYTGELNIRAFVDGIDIGGVLFSPTNRFDEAQFTDAFAKGVGLLKQFRGKYRDTPIASEMYRFAAELGNDIRPEKDHSQTGDGSRMWKNHEKHGLAIRDDKGLIIPRSETPIVPSIGKKQRGGPGFRWDPGATREAIVKSVNNGMEKLKKGFPKSEESQKQDVVNRIPGMKKEAYISKDVEFTPELKETILNEKDGSSLWMFTPGRVGRQEISGVTNRLVATIGRYWENARNRYELIIDRDVEPMKQALNGVLRSAQETEVLSTILKKELERKQAYSREQLQEAGVSERVIDAHIQLRENFAKVIDKINAVRKDKGQKEVTALEGYMSARWLGPWKAKVTDSEGKVVYWIAEPNRMARARAIDYFKQNHPEFKITEMKYDAQYKIGKDSLDAGYSELLALFGKNDPLVAQVKEVLDARNEGSTENIGGVEQHFKRKTGMGGYAGDRPWADTLADQKDMLRQQVEYIQRALLWAEQQKALELSNKILNDPEIKEARKNDVEYAKELAKMEMGWNTADVVRRFEDKIADLTGVNVGTYAQGLGMAKSFFYMTKLGFSAPFILVSLIQPALVLPSAILAAKGKGGSALYGALVDGQRLMSRQLILEYGKDILPKEMADFFAKDKGDAFFDEAANYAYANRVTEVNQLTDIRDVTAGPVRQKVERSVGATISVPELVARSNTYMSLVHSLKHQFDVSTHEGRMQLFETAAEKTKEIMGDYNPEHKAPIYQRLGLVGNALSTLQTFMINQAYQVWKYSRLAAKGNPAPLAAHLMMMLAFGGATGFMMVDDAEDALNYVKEEWLTDEQFADAKDFSIKGLIAENLPDLVAYGGASKVTGLNLYTRFAMGDFLQAPPFESSGSSVLENYAPFISDLWKQVMAAKDLAVGDKAKKLEAGYVLTPAGARGLYEELVPGVKRGDIVPQMSNLAVGQVRRPPENVPERLWGFRDVEEQKEIDRAFQERVRKNVINNRVKSVREKFQKAVAVQDPEAMIKAIQTAVKLDYDPSPWLENVDQTALNAATTTAERELIKLSKLTKPNKEQTKQMQIWANIYNAK